MIWSWCHCECFISFHVIGKSHVNVIWCHMMAFNRICPGHCKLRKTHKWWHASDFFLHFRTGCFGVLRLSNDIYSCWHDFYSIYRFVPRKLRGFVSWFYHWRHQLRTKQRDYINTYYHTSHTQKKYVEQINMLFFVQQKNKNPTCSPGDSCSRILSNSLKWPDSTRRSACEGELTEGRHDGCTGRPCA